MTKSRAWNGGNYTVKMTPTLKKLWLKMFVENIAETIGTLEEIKTAARTKNTKKLKSLLKDSDNCLTRYLLWTVMPAGLKKGLNLKGEM